MSKQSVDYLDVVLQQCFGPGFGSCPQMRRAELQTLFTDDAVGRLAHAWLAATQWASTEVRGHVAVISDRLAITPRGLVYVAELSETASGLIPGQPPHPFHMAAGAGGVAASSGRRLYYLATPLAFFEPIVDQVSAIPMRPDSAAAVDSRLSDDLVFAWPLDARLRHILDAHEVLRLNLRGYHHSAPPIGAL